MPLFANFNFKNLSVDTLEKSDFTGRNILQFAISRMMLLSLYSLED